MNSIQSYTDYETLCQVINRLYPIHIDQIVLHREMIGYVYIASNHTQKYILKLYRWFDAENARRAVQIIHYLKQNEYPVAAIVPTASGSLHVTLQTPLGPSVAVLFDYIEGCEPALGQEIIPLGRQVGRLHRLMETYPQPLLRRGKDFYIDRYIALLDELKYPSARIDEMAAYGQELWRRMESLPASFCHGDLHTGNMIQSGPNQYVLFDFDVASRTSVVIDVATLCNVSDFNQFDAAAYAGTRRVFEQFYQGYSQEKELTGAEIAAIFDFIPIRHYEIIATIVLCQETHTLSRAFLDEQYGWLMDWKNLCARQGQQSL